MSSKCITYTTIAGAGQLSFNTCLRCTWYRGLRSTHQIPVQCWTSVAAYSWFNVVQSSTTLAQHQSITGSVIYFAQTLAIQPMLFQCWHTVFDAGPSLKQHWVIVPCFWLLHYAGDSLTSRRQKHQITRCILVHCWCSAGPPSATPGQHYSNENPLGS